MNYLPDLRSSLVEAAERAASTGERLPAPPLGRSRRWPLAGLRALPIAIGVGVAIAIAVLALTQFRHAPTAAHHTSVPATEQPPDRQALLNILGVLRRPQTGADRNSRALTRNLKYVVQDFGVTPDYSLIRRATTTPWGSPVYLVPVKPVAVHAIHAPAGSTRYAPLASQNYEGLMEVDGSGAGGDAKAADIEAGHLLGASGAGHSFAGGSTQTRVILVVPDGVAKVTFVFPRQADHNDPGAPIYRRTLTVTAPVHGNVVALQVPRECCGSNVPMIWYAADGHVVKRLGNLAAANRVIPPPSPAPRQPSRAPPSVTRQPPTTSGSPPPPADPTPNTSSTSACSSPTPTTGSPSRAPSVPRSR